MKITTIIADPHQAPTEASDRTKLRRFAADLRRVLLAVPDVADPDASEFVGSLRSLLNWAEKQLDKDAEAL